jgi:hypothetical protein
MKMGEMAVYTGDFALAVNKKWRKLSVPVDKSPVMSESQGSKHSKTTPVKALFVHPVTEKEVSGIACPVLYRRYRNGQGKNQRSGRAVRTA